MSVMFRRFALLLGAVLVIALSGCAGGPKKASTGEFVDDTIITTRVKTELFKEPDIKSAQVAVETFKGEVQLSGFVSNRQTIDKAVAIARKVPGVKSVKNSLVLR